MPENALYYSPDVDERARDQYQNSLLIPYLNQRPNMLQQAADYWGPQLEKSIGPGIAETLAQKRAGTYRAPTANELWEDPFLNALAPGNLGMVGMLVGPKSRLWKTAPQVGEDVPRGAFSNLYDRKPMMEIADNEAKVLMPPPRSPLEVKIQLAQKLYDKKIGELTKEENSILTLMVKEQKMKGSVPLGSIFDHPELYNSYPELSEIPVYLHIDKSLAPSGAFDSGTGSLRINAPSLEEAKSTLLHEIQHAIQEREGWAKGGSPTREIESARQSLGSEASTMAVANEAARRYDRLFGEYMSRDTASRAPLSPLQRMSNMPFSSEPGMTPDNMIYRYER